MKSTNQLVREIKENGEDWEFYPTTAEIVDCIASHANNRYDVRSILDIGCGNGGFFQKLGRHKDFDGVRKYGIEKSHILAEQLPDDVVLLGTDFHYQNLIDKKVDMIFCNPPYSEYAEWAEKIIKTGNARKIVLVIPSRWSENKRIEKAIEQRKFSCKTLGTFDFENAERRARATVDVVYLWFDTVCGSTSPFDIWFDETFKVNAEKAESYEWEEKDAKKAKVEQELVEGGNTAEMLVKFYNDDLAKIHDNYMAVEKLDSELLKELQVNVLSLKKALQKRLEGLKVLYWDMLFKRYDRITSRLTTKGRDKVINRLNSNTAIDFTLDNIYQITMWIIRHSNTLYDEQLTDFFYSLCNADSIHRYKSNKRWNDDEWRYIKDIFKDNWTRSKREREIKNVQLDYRLVVESYSNFDTWVSTKLSASCRDFLNDVCVVGKNLGFDIADFEIPRHDIIIADWQNFDITTKDGAVFCNVKLYKNGNRHLKFCKEFMQKLNVEMARINGWVQDKTEAMREMDVPEDVINSVWKANLQIGIESGKKLLGLPEVAE